MFVECLGQPLGVFAEVSSTSVLTDAERTQQSCVRSLGAIRKSDVDLARELRHRAFGWRIHDHAH